MDSLRFGLALLGLLMATLATSAPAPENLRLMTWNIWHGGRENDRFRGPRQVMDVIRQSQADVVMMQETYGSGELIARGLDFHFQPRGTNVSLHSRYPIEEDLSVGEPFNCVGALVRLPSGRRVAVYSLWLPYGEDIWIPATRRASSLEAMLAACQPSAEVLERLLDQIHQRLAGPQYADVPVVIGGDFNSMSHLDYTEVAREYYGRPVRWATSQLMTGQGYRDAFRELHPQISRAQDRTWSPRFPEQEQDRIDFIYFRGVGVEPVRAERIDTSAGLFPSDHAAVLAELRLGAPVLPREVSLRAATYNIRHGAGMDDRLDLDRTVRALRALKADIIGLQEIDDRVGRSERVNQMAELGRQLGMHPAFGSFMEYDGGQYGMGILSRYPLVDVDAIRLPDGNEPRVALQALVRLPSGETLRVVNVHFDWVDDDGFRWAQAQRVHQAVTEGDGPTLLLGDFNDGPESRTLGLFRGSLQEVAKPAGQRFTWPADRPTQEIDYLFVGPPARWQVGTARVVNERAASDHRPVVADLKLRPSPQG